jgi:oligopeptide/dipeptide ABC transporter ATP-binding protein
MQHLVETYNLTKHFTTSSFLGRAVKVVHAVDDVSIHIDEGETLGLAGESGCGKSTLGRTLVQLMEPTSGEVLFKGRNLRSLKRHEIKELRQKVSMVCQDPLGALNPRRTILQSLALPFRVHTTMNQSEIHDKVLSLLDFVGLSPAEFYVDRLPHEFSGGQRQRINIARAISLNPDFLVADEPVSALDLSVRAQILDLMKQLKERLNIACLFITHDLSVLRSVSDRVAIMYLGRVVELGQVDDLYLNPLHPYTKAILSATPVPNPKRKSERIILAGDVPSATDPPLGCRFHTRCWARKANCSKDEPRLEDAGSDHFVACHI